MALLYMTLLIFFKKLKAILDSNSFLLQAEAGIEAGIYNIIPGDFFLRTFREALEVNTAESIKQVVGVVDGILMIRMMLRAPCRLIAAEVRCVYYSGT